MKRTCQHPRLLALAVTAVGILLDQLTKLLVSGGMALGDTIPIIKDVLHITYVRNTGAAFGMLADHRWVFLVISTVTILALAVFLLRTTSRDPLLIVSVSMVLSGGIGNMIDRVALGYVVDFIDFRLINFAVFNGADSFVCVGAALLFLAVLLEPKKKEEPAAEDEPQAEDDGRDA
ncbi:MAG: signal peptidase II [Clostridia bacterium]|nr:signal peptidase II [Clostridia bacterium]